MSAFFGTTGDGLTARLFTLSEANDLTVRVTDFGATIVAVHVPDRQGSAADIVLGFDDVSGYESEANAYFGATIGRVANRIAQATFSIGDRSFSLAPNEPPHHLHGGARRSFDKVLWEVTHTDDQSIAFSYVSPAGEEGYPGRVQAAATYRVAGDALTVEYRAVTDDVTPLNMTNHTYWNLRGAGDGTILDHELQIEADSYTPTDDDLIPSGAFAGVAGTPLDFRTPVAVGARIEALIGTGARGYDHNFVLRGPSGGVRPAARLRDPQSHRVLEVATTEPGLQCYSGNLIEGTVVGKNGGRYVQHGALCLEPQYYPDAVHRPEFPSILLEPGRTYEHTTVYRLFCE